MLTEYQIIFQLVDDHNVDTDRLSNDLANYCCIFSADERRFQEYKLRELTSFIETWGCEITYNFSHPHLDRSSISSSIDFDTDAKFIRFRTFKKDGECCAINMFIPFLIFHIGERNIVSFTPIKSFSCMYCEKMYKKFILTDEIKQKMENTRTDFSGRDREYNEKKEKKITDLNTRYKIIFQLTENHTVSMKKLYNDLPKSNFVFSLAGRESHKLELKELIFFIEQWIGRILENYKDFQIYKDNIDLEENNIVLHTSMAYGDCCLLHILIPLMIFHIREENIVSITSNCSSTLCKKCKHLYEATMVLDENMRHDLKKLRFIRPSHSWGEFYETMKACDGFEEQREKFEIFEELDKAISLSEIKKIIQRLTQEQINWLNSPCLDGLVFCLHEGAARTWDFIPTKKLQEKEFVETFKYLWGKRLINIPLKSIAAKGFAKLTRFFLENDIDTEAKNDALLDALWNTETVKVLLEFKATIDDEEAFYKACKNGWLESVKLLVENGLCLSYIDEAIRRAVVWNHDIEIFRFLLDRGIHVHTRNILLYESCYHNNIEILTLLLEKGATISDYKIIPWEWLCTRNYIEVVKFLLEKGAKMHPAAINIALQSKNVEMVQLLTAYGASISEEKYKHLQKKLKFLIDIGIKLE